LQAIVVAGIYGQRTDFDSLTVGAIHKSALQRAMVTPLTRKQ
jgi:hypothetical protein